MLNEFMVHKISLNINLSLLGAILKSTANAHLDHKLQGLSSEKDRPRL